MKPIVCEDTGETVHSYAEYLQTEHWRGVREAFFRRNKRTCADCGATGIPIQLHHLHYSNIGKERDEDLRPLCDSCHESWHHADSRPKNPRKHGKRSRKTTRQKRRERKLNRKKKGTPKNEDVLLNMYDSLQRSQRKHWTEDRARRLRWIRESLRAKHHISV